MIGRPSPVVHVLAIALAWSVAAPVGAEEAADLAREHYSRGRQLENEGDFAHALESYQLAQRARPVYRMHRHLGRVLRGLGRYREALVHYRAFLDEGGDRIDPEDREEAIAAIADLETRVAFLRIEAPEGATVMLDGTEVGQAPFAEPVIAEPGSLRIVVHLEGYQDLTIEIETRGGGTHDVRAVLEPLAAEEPLPSEPLPGVTPEIPGSTAASSADRRRLDRRLFWSMAGLATAALATGAVLGVLALVEQESFDDLNDPHREPSEDAALEASQHRGLGYSVAADVLFGVGAAFAAAALVIAFFTDFDGHAVQTDSQRAHSGRLGLSPLGLWGRF